MTDEVLKPCPFCGGEAEITRFGTARYSTAYECTNCGASLETGETANHGLVWNERHSENKIKANAIREAVEYNKTMSGRYGDICHCDELLEHADKVEGGEL